LRISKKFKLSNPREFQQKLLIWGQQFDEIAWLDSNKYQENYSRYDAVLAVQAFTALKTDYDGAFDQLQEYQEITKDWIFGYLSYDLKNDVEDLTSNNFDGLHFPELYFFQPQKIFLLNEGVLEIQYLRIVEEEIESDFEEIQRTMNSGNKTAENKPIPDLKTGALAETKSHKSETLKQESAIKSRISKQQYLEKVNEMLRYVHRGDIYEANFCQEFFVENLQIEPLQVFEKLNKISAPPFAVFMKLEKNYLLSASPERYLKKEGSKIISQPIKGTARRAKNRIEDAKISAELAIDFKEQSENVMIVDLVRNDLSRTAKKGSVKVEELCRVYSFKQVHQLVSTISAELEEDISLVEVLRSTFPMGSMTGAPKISAMKIIEKLEETKRGLYSGAVGYFTPEGNFDFSVVIRSILYNSKNKYLSFSVGGAITANSIPEKEYQECLLKARAMHRAISG